MGVPISLLPPAAQANLTDIIPKVNDPGGAAETQKLTLDQVKTLLNGGVKVYRALISQSGTDAPVATVLENSLGGVPVMSFSNTGQFYATLAGSFPAGKTFTIMSSCDGWNADQVRMNCGRKDDDNIFFESVSSMTGTPIAFDSSAVVAFEILVYP